MSLAIFDLDNTLIADDSDYLWGQFLVEQKQVDGHFYESRNQYFYDEYKKGTLDIYEFLAFSLKPLSQMNMATLQQLHHNFMEAKIKPAILPKAQALIKHHQDAGHETLIITATNAFITSPIASLLGISNLLATDPEIINNQYTGKVAGIPCFQEGKVERLNRWLSENHNQSENHKPLEESWFYSDSHNDLPLLQMVTHPVAVDPDEKLHHHATCHQWQIISLR